MELTKKVSELCSSVGINFDVDETSFIFQFYSEYGQDFNCYIDLCNDKVSLCNNLRDWIDSFNCFDEARLWVDEDGHGKSGAPYYYRDIVKDMGYCKRKIRSLLKLFRESI